MADKWGNPDFTDFWNTFSAVEGIKTNRAKNALQQEQLKDIQTDRVSKENQRAYTNALSDFKGNYEDPTEVAGHIQKKLGVSEVSQTDVQAAATGMMAYKEAGHIFNKNLIEGSIERVENAYKVADQAFTQGGRQYSKEKHEEFLRVHDLYNDGWTHGPEDYDWENKRITLHDETGSREDKVIDMPSIDTITGLVSSLRDKGGAPSMMAVQEMLGGVAETRLYNDKQWANRKPMINKNGDIIYKVEHFRDPGSKKKTDTIYMDDNKLIIQDPKGFKLVSEKTLALGIAEKEADILKSDAAASASHKGARDAKTAWLSTVADVAFGGDKSKALTWLEAQDLNEKKAGILFKMVSDEALDLTDPKDFKTARGMMDQINSMVKPTPQGKGLPGPDADTTTPPPKGKPKGVVMKTMPDPAKYKGEFAKRPDGVVVQSNGVEWLPVK